MQVVVKMGGNDAEVLEMEPPMTTTPADDSQRCPNHDSPRRIGVPATASVGVDPGGDGGADAGRSLPGWEGAAWLGEHRRGGDTRIMAEREVSCNR